MSRAFVVVLDACGVGALPDSAAYGDAGANTLGHLAQAAGGLWLPTLGRLGLGSILAARGRRRRPPRPGAPRPAPPARRRQGLDGRPLGADGRRHPAIAADVPGRVPGRGDRGRRRRRAAGRRSSATARTTGSTRSTTSAPSTLADGALIVYTSQDSVLQIAAHERVVGARRALRGLPHGARSGSATEHAVGRVIARPFTGAPGAFARTEGRRDYALPPAQVATCRSSRTAGVPVHTVGKVGPAVRGVGIDVAASRGDERHGARVRRPSCSRRSSTGSCSRT